MLQRRIVSPILTTVVLKKVYTSNESVDMYLILGKCLGNVAEAAREYSLRYPHRYHPDNKAFLRLNQRVRDTGRLVATHKVGRPRTTRTPALEDVVFEVVDDQASVGQIASELGVGCREEYCSQNFKIRTTRTITQKCKLFKKTTFLVERSMKTKTLQSTCCGAMSRCSPEMEFSIPIIIITGPPRIPMFAI
jgi:hypothetical protein